MALTRKMLKALGIEDEKIDQIIEAHTEVTDSLISERDSYKAEAEKIPNLKQEISDLKKANADDWKNKYEKEHADFEAYKSDVDTKRTVERKKELYKGLLAKANVDAKRHDSILKVVDWNSIELDKDGNLKKADDVSKAILSDWSGFIVGERTEGSSVETPPAHSHDMTKEAFEKMPLSERMSYANAHQSEVAGFYKK